MSEEPTVLDFVKALLTPWRGAPPVIPPADVPPEEAAARPLVEPAAAPPEALPPPAPAEPHAWTPPPPASLPEAPGTQTPWESRPAAPAQTAPEPESPPGPWPWRALLALGLALLAQRSLEPGPERAWLPGLILYLGAASLLVWSAWRREWRLPPLPDRAPTTDPMTVRSLPLWVGLPLAALAFLTFGGNRFTTLNVLVWLLTLALLLRAFWLPGPPRPGYPACLRAFLARPDWSLTVTRWGLLVVLLAGVVIFYRFYRMADTPPEMVSDHAEKLLDVWDVLQGETSIFFPRNTGREALQMYMTATIARYLGTGVSFTSLKIGTILAGLLTLPFLYLLGVEVANRRAGLLAVFFAGVAYWPNVVSRIGLRFPLYALFAAPTLYFLIRGLRRGTRNDFLLAGLALGIGLHGYTPIRILPFVVVVAVAIYLLHRQSTGFRKQAIWGLALLAFIALIVFLPLGRFWVENPDTFGFRAFSRLGSIEQPLPGPAAQVFLSNLGRALLMFGWDDGEIWPISIPHRPALDVASAALFHLGVVLLVVRYLRRRHWLDLFLLLSIPLLMLPSILSLAFPGENPAPNRASAVLVPVFLIVALAADGLLQGLQRTLGGARGRRLAWATAIVLAGWAALQNYDLVFNRYQSQYALAAWNTSEMGAVIREFGDTLGDMDNAWVLGYPHWVDTRLVAMHAGQTTRDAAITLENLNDTRAITSPKLFLVNPEDEAGLRTLRNVYPAGWLQIYESKTENKNFYMFFVPPTP